MSRQADPTVPARPGQPVAERREIHDRITSAIRVLRFAGVTATPKQVMVATGLDMHSQRDELEGWVAAKMRTLP